MLYTNSVLTYIKYRDKVKISPSILILNYLITIVRQLIFRKTIKNIFKYKHVGTTYTPCSHPREVLHQKLLVTYNSDRVFLAQLKFILNYFKSQRNISPKQQHMFKIKTIDHISPKWLYPCIIHAPGLYNLNF